VRRNNISIKEAAVPALLTLIIAAPNISPAPW